MVRMGKGGGQEMEETKRMQGEWAGETKGWMCLGWGDQERIQEQNQVDHLGPQWPKGFKS